MCQRLNLPHISVLLWAGEPKIPSQVSKHQTEPGDLGLAAGSSSLPVYSKEMWLQVRDGKRGKSHFAVEKGDPKQMIKVNISG